MQLCIPPPCSSLTHSAVVNNMGVSSSRPAQETSVSVWAWAPVTCSSYYWTLFRLQSRKEERRGALIAHLNRGCHIINAYRPALQAVTETPSHSSREQEWEWDINSCERRDGYQEPEIKWLALEEMRQEIRHVIELEFGVCVLHPLFWCMSLSTSNYVQLKYNLQKYSQVLTFSKLILNKLSIFWSVKWNWILSSQLVWG